MYDEYLYNTLGVKASAVLMHILVHRCIIYSICYIVCRYKGSIYLPLPRAFLSECSQHVHIFIIGLSAQLCPVKLRGLKPMSE